MPLVVVRGCDLMSNGSSAQAEYSSGQLMLEAVV